MAAKLFFRYGTMGSGKSLHILATAYNFDERNIPFLVLKSAVDTRDIGVIHSRALGDRTCIIVNPEESIKEAIGSTKAPFGRMEALEYLKRQTRYGQGYAYEKNVEYLAQYIEDIVLSLDDENMKNNAIQLAMVIRGESLSFKEEWISMIYSLFYEVRNAGFDSGVAGEAIRRTYEIIQG